MNTTARAHGTAPLREVLGASELHDLRELHLASATSPVRDVALIADIEEVSSLGPDTIALLTQSVARGGWMISAALRYAWERRACALIVPERSVSETVIELARRLGISLFGTERDMTRVALDVAIRIGVARAGSLARIQSFSERVGRAADLDAALAEIADELDGSPVAIESGGAVAVRLPAEGASTADARGAAADPDTGEEPTRVAVGLAPGEDGDDALTAEVPQRLEPLAERVLAAATPAIRALLAASRLRALRDSLPPISITALTGARPISGLDAPARETLEGALAWPVSGTYLAVCVMTRDRDRFGSAVHQLWDSGFPDVPLARFSDGWLAFVPLADEDARRTLLAEMRDRLEEVRSLDLMVGVSRARSGSESAARSVREAWFAARMCAPDHPSEPPLVAFDRIAHHLPARLLPADFAEQLAGELFPDLMGDPAQGELIRSVAAFLAHRGSASAAAAALGVHRNTLQARLRRAETLGVDLADPATTLSTHLLLAAIVRTAG